MNEFLIAFFLLVNSCWVAFGDSITWGASATPGNSYVEILSTKVGPIDNQAQTGSRLSNQIKTIENFDGNASNVIWLVGYNDMRAGTPIETMRAELISGLDILSKRGAKVYLGNCPRMTQEGYTAYGPDWNHGSDEQVAEINRAIAEVAANYPNVVLVDMGDYDPEIGTAADMVHPDDAGHCLISGIFARAIFRVYLPSIFSSAKSATDALGAETENTGTAGVDQRGPRAAVNFIVKV